MDVVYLEFEICYLLPGLTFVLIKRSSSLFKKLLLIIYSPPCHPRFPCLSIGKKENKFFEENIPAFFSI